MDLKLFISPPKQRRWREEGGKTSVNISPLGFFPFTFLSYSRFGLSARFLSIFLVFFPVINVGNSMNSIWWWRNDKVNVLFFENDNFFHILRPSYEKSEEDIVSTQTFFLSKMTFNQFFHRFIILHCFEKAIVVKLFLVKRIVWYWYQFLIKLIKITGTIVIANKSVINQALKTKDF